MRIFTGLFYIFILAFSAAFSSESRQVNKFTIFSGDKKASYYAVANGICVVFNRHYLAQGFECVVKESDGSEKNLHLLANKEADVAVIKSLEFNKFFVENAQELQSKTDFIAKVHDEYLTILVQKNLEIKSLSDFSEKIVNTGKIGSTSELVIKKYFSSFNVKPKKIVNFGAADSLKALCDKKIDAWIYFIGHPNAGYKKALEKCDLKLIELSVVEVENFLKVAPFFKEAFLSKNLYKALKRDLKTISSETILASKKSLDPQISNLIKDILAHHKDELAQENAIFNFLTPKAK